MTIVHIKHGGPLGGHMEKEFVGEYIPIEFLEGLNLGYTLFSPELGEEVEITIHLKPQPK
jgi:hypothetical protein